VDDRSELNPAETEERAIRPWSSFVFRDFTLFWVSSVLAATAVQVRNVASLYQVYDISGSSFQLGLTGFFQALPFVVFGLFAGVLADTFDRKKLIIVTQIASFLPCFLLGVLTATGAIRVWHVYLLSLLSSLAEVLNWPTRASIVPRLVPKSHLMNAVTLTTMITQSSFLVGPAVAGVLIDTIGLDLTYFAAAGLFVPSIGTIAALRTPTRPEGARRKINLRSFTEGVEFIWVKRIILSLFLLDFGVTLVGFYKPLLPIFATDVFGLGGIGLGALYSAPAAGALLGSFSLLLMGNFRRMGALAIASALAFAASLAFLGMSKWFWTAAVAVLVLGFTDSLSVSIRRTVVQILSPDQMLGRANSLITVFAQCTNALGALLAGTAAELLGAPQALLWGSAVCVLVVLTTHYFIPQLWRYSS
jgi:MFS family permease